LRALHLFRTSATGYGLERNLLCTLPGLVEQGVETAAVAVVEGRSGGVSRDFAERLDRAGVRLIPLRSGGRVPVKLARRLSGVFRAEGPDIVHSHGYKCDLAMLLAATGNAARVTTIHGWCSRNVKERVYEWLNVRFCRRMDVVIALCEDYRRRLVERGVPGRLVRVAPVGTSTDAVPRGAGDCRETWNVPADGVLVAQLGRLSPEKRPDLFVELAAGLCPTLPSARFVLVGDGAMLEPLRRHVRSLGLEDRILFAGYVQGMADVFDAVDVVVNCSSTEGVPRTLLEAGMAGVPAVATAVGGVPDIVADGVTGIVCGADDAEGVGRGVERLARDAALRKRMGEAARRRISEVFSVAACSRRLVEVYEEALAARRAGRR